MYNIELRTCRSLGLKAVNMKEVQPAASTAQLPPAVLSGLSSPTWNLQLWLLLVEAYNADTKHSYAEPLCLSKA